MRAALARLNPNHPHYSRLQSHYASRVAGLVGEQQVDQVFQRYSFKMKHNIFNGLSLTSSTKFQIDSLFLTPSYAVIFETKNLAGSIKVKNNPPQLIQTLDDGKVKSYVSPIVQLQNNTELLQDWFYYRKISLPIYGAIILAFPKKEVELFDTDVKFLYPAGIPSFIRTLPTPPPLLDQKSFLTVTKDLINSDADYIPHPIYLSYSIPIADFSSGVACSSCQSLGMTKYQGGWLCKVCSFKSRDAHRQAIRDWFLLFGEKMTNENCREFLHLPRRQTATRILTSMNMHLEGEKRNRTYSMKSFK